MRTRLWGWDLFHRAKTLKVQFMKILCTELADNETINYLIFFFHCANAHSVLLFYFVFVFCLKFVFLWTPEDRSQQSESYIIFWKKCGMGMIWWLLFPPRAISLAGWFQGKATHLQSLSISSLPKLTQNSKNSLQPPQQCPAFLQALNIRLTRYIKLECMDGSGLCVPQRVHIWQSAC